MYKSITRCIYQGIEFMKARNTVFKCQSFPSTPDLLTCAISAAIHGEAAQTIDLHIGSSVMKKWYCSSKIDPSLRTKLRDSSMRPNLRDSSMGTNLRDSSMRAKLRDSSMRAKLWDPSSETQAWDPSSESQAWEPTSDSSMRAKLRLKHESQPQRFKHGNSSMRANLRDLVSSGTAALWLNRLEA